MGTNFVRCENGHLYNAAEHAECPYCVQTHSNYIQYAARSDENITVRSMEGDGRDIRRPEDAGKIMNLSEDKTVKYAAETNKSLSPKEDMTIKLSEAGFKRKEIDPVAVAMSVSDGIYQPDMSDGSSCRTYPESRTPRQPEEHDGKHDQFGNYPLKPVGWLLCIEGPDFGKSFPLRDGKNSIGRSDEMDIVLGNDRAVSRRNHVWIEYREEERDFIVSVGETRKMVYVNDDLLLLPLIMGKNDILTLGDSSLMLIPCCDGAFSWKSIEGREG